VEHVVDLDLSRRLLERIEGVAVATAVVNIWTNPASQRLQRVRYGRRRKF
jgi:hypothetical protein